MWQDATFSKVEGVVKTSVGYTGGSNPEPTYNSVCSNDGHTEAIKVVYDPSKVSYEQLLKVSHWLTAMALHHPIFDQCLWCLVPMGDKLVASTNPQCFLCCCRRSSHIMIPAEHLAR